MKKPFDPTKPVQTRDGQPARILCSDADGKRPIIALVHTSNDTEEPHSYTSSGKCFVSPGMPSPLDLVNVPTRYFVRRWAVVDACGCVCLRDERPPRCLDGCCIAIKEIIIEITEGEGL